MAEGMDTTFTPCVHVYTLSDSVQRMSESRDPVSTTSSVDTLSGRVYRTSESLDTIVTVPSVDTLSDKSMVEGLDTVSTTSSVYTLSGRVRSLAEGLDTKSLTSFSSGTLSSKVQLGPADCDTCLETRLVWTRPCCLVKTCLPCLEAYVEGKIRDGVIDIQCPGHSCDTHLTHCVIKRAVDTDKAKRFSFLCIKSDRFEYKKACPMCDHVVTLDDTFLHYFGSLESIIACPKCLKEWCFQCMVPWHEGYTCAEYKSLKSDTGVDKWAGKQQKNTGERNAQQCPKCKIWIQKTDGCYFMTCKECKTNFCYICGVQTPHPKSCECRAPNPANRFAIRGPRLGPWNDFRTSAARVRNKCSRCCSFLCKYWFIWIVLMSICIIVPIVYHFRISEVYFVIGYVIFVIVFSVIASTTKCLDICCPGRSASTYSTGDTYSTYQTDW